MAKRRKPINREPLPYKSFILGLRKYRVIRWGDTVKGQKTLIVKLEFTCTNIPWPSIKLNAEESKEMVINFPIENRTTKITYLN